MLRGKRLVIAGVDGDGSLAYPIADHALRGGAFVTLVATPKHFARCRERVDWLPRGAHAVRADLTVDADVAGLHEHLRCAFGAVDGAVHVSGGGERSSPQALAALAAGIAPLLTPGGGPLVAVAPDERDPQAVAEAVSVLLAAGAGADTRAGVEALAVG